MHTLGIENADMGRVDKDLVGIRSLVEGGNSHRGFRDDESNHVLDNFRVDSFLRKVENRAFHGIHGIHGTDHRNVLTVAFGNRSGRKDVP